MLQRLKGDVAVTVVLNWYRKRIDEHHVNRTHSLAGRFNPDVFVNCLLTIVSSWQRPLGQNVLLVSIIRNCVVAHHSLSVYVQSVLMQLSMTSMGFTIAQQLTWYRVTSASKTSICFFWDSLSILRNCPSCWQSLILSFKLDNCRRHIKWQQQEVRIYALYTCFRVCRPVDGCRHMGYALAYTFTIIGHAGGLTSEFTVTPSFTVLGSGIAVCRWATSLQSSQAAVPSSSVSSSWRRSFRAWSCGRGIQWV